MPDKRKEPKLKVLDIERSRDIILKTLLPNATLDSVGKEYGLTRERIRQIFYKTTGHSPKELRRKFLAEGDAFRCPICGEPLNPRTHTKYCSTKCYSVTKKYDVATLRNCEHCKGMFFPLRNWKSIQKVGYGQYGGKYCSTKCFIEHMVQEKRWGRKRPLPLDQIVP